MYISDLDTNHSQRIHSTTSSGGVGIPRHALGMTFCQIFTFCFLAGVIKIVALSLLALAATRPFPDQIFGVAKVSPQFLERVGSSG